ncbi:MAG TPA: hypothetical protein PLP29_12800 [Candidatus Ozemobacteraceae bacterium]|nr:hypothetical protein [Candidatus Ozemobacteraceae bacterium]
MKVEIRVNETPAADAGGEQEGSRRELVPARQAIQAAGQDVAIDIAQVLAANQALLTNIARKMETMETRIHSLESVIEEQRRAMISYTHDVALLAAPPAPVQVWKPAAGELDEAWFGRFSFLDRWFRPYKMRRPNAED